MRTRPAYRLLSPGQPFNLSFFNFPGTCVIHDGADAYYKFRNSFEGTLHGNGGFFCERTPHRLPGEEDDRGNVE